MKKYIAVIVSFAYLLMIPNAYTKNIAGENVQIKKKVEISSCNDMVPVGGKNIQKIEQINTVFIQKMYDSASHILEVLGYKEATPTRYHGVAGAGEQGFNVLDGYIHQVDALFEDTECGPGCCAEIMRYGPFRIGMELKTIEGETRYFSYLQFTKKDKETRKFVTTRYYVLEADKKERYLETVTLNREGEIQQRVGIWSNPLDENKVVLSRPRKSTFERILSYLFVLPFAVLSEPFVFLINKIRKDDWHSPTKTVFRDEPNEIYDMRLNNKKVIEERKQKFIDKVFTPFFEGHTILDYSFEQIEGKSTKYKFNVKVQLANGKKKLYKFESDDNMQHLLIRKFYLVDCKIKEVDLRISVEDVVGKKVYAQDKAHSKCRMQNLNRSRLMIDSNTGILSLDTSDQIQK